MIWLINDIMTVKKIIREQRVRGISLLLRQKSKKQELWQRKYPFTRTKVI